MNTYTQTDTQKHIHTHTHTQTHTNTHTHIQKQVHAHTHPYSTHITVLRPTLTVFIIIPSGYHFKPWMLNDVDTKALTYHRITEAFKFAYAKRSNLGDEDFVDVEQVSTSFTPLNHELSIA